MNFLDIALICIVVIFTIRGFFRGLVQEALSLIAILLAIFLATNYQHLLIPHLELYIHSAITVSALASVILFFGTIILFWLIAKAVRSMLEIALLGWVDRLTGALFGCVEGAIIGLILLIFLQSFSPNSSQLRESSIAPRVQHLMKLTGDLLPEGARETLMPKGFSLPSAQQAMDSAKEAIGFDDEIDNPQ
ncbi:CvpA family protein [Pseudodesulfovibrio piezophilus]|uniref:Colicin V production protein n=1 Tax=Pseudodesulfovibrio piezophilus (strain DSM 21447 / JCM 15486 / C1TLV30) TaxID=1322246 RepID=M1WLH1_PSEP2|nr:CvpA family protein [Pseudodesulfovibrio piezophilus]CCH47855.1 Colicin V production protein [Pseudodesulfovibrio piezophilus C1TLV30]